MEWQCDSFSSKMSGKHRNSAEFAHCSGCAENNSVKQLPADMGEGYPAEDREAAGSHHGRSLLLVSADGLQNRYQLP